MADSTANSGDHPCCAECGKPLAGRDRDRSTCHECRSPQGKLADLDVAIRASGDNPDRIREWPEIRYCLRKRFGDNRPDAELWERFTDWLQAERRLQRNDFLRIPLDQVRGLLADDATGTADAVKPVVAGTAKKSKRSTERGEGQAKLISALTHHHKYADGSCFNLEPIGNNELARLAGVSESTASAFFNKQFKGHTKYRAICGDATRLVTALKLLNQEFAPHLLFGAKPPDEGEREEEE